MYVNLIRCKMMQARKANEKVSNCSETELCITVKVLRMLSQRNARKPFKCDRDPIVQVTILNRNLTQFRPSEIHANQIRLNEIVA